MSKIEVTVELASTIKALRIENKVSAKELAAYLGKSPSYISKFENGQIKSILREDLDKIFKFIISDETAFDEKVNQILDISVKRYDKKEIENQLWFYNYSTVYCKRPVPEELIDEVNKMLEEYSITREYLLERINGNEFLKHEFGKFRSDNGNFPYNEWFIRNPEQDPDIEILINLSLEKLNKILEKREKSTKYVFIQAIVLYLLKIVQYREIIYLPKEEVRKLNAATREFLAKHKFYSLAEREQHQNKPDELNIHDRRAREEVLQLFSRLQFISNLDVQYTNDVFSSFTKNLDWDQSFMLGLIALPFHRIGDMSHKEKKELFDKIKEALTETIEKPKEQQALDKYEF